MKRKQDVLIGAVAAIGLLFVLGAGTIDYTSTFYNVTVRTNLTVNGITSLQTIHTPLLSGILKSDGTSIVRATAEVDYTTPGFLTNRNLTMGSGFLLGRYTSGNGNIQYMTLGTGLSLDPSTGVITAAGGGGSGSDLTNATVHGTLTVTGTASLQNFTTALGNGLVNMASGTAGIATPEVDYTVPGFLTNRNLTMGSGFLLGRYAASNGNVQYLTLDSSLALSGTGVLKVANNQTLSGNLTVLGTTSLQNFTTSLGNGIVNMTSGSAGIATPEVDYTVPGFLTNRNLTVASGYILGRYTSGNGNVQYMTLGTGFNLDTTNGTLTTTFPTNIDALTITTLEVTGTATFDTSFILGGHTYTDDGSTLKRDGTAITGGGASVDDTAFASSWNGVTTTAPSKNTVYDIIHAFDTDDDGKVNVLDQGVGIPVTDSGGVLQTPITTSAGVAGAISDETGTGSMVFNTSPTFNTSVTISGGTVSANSPALNISQTWNNSGVVFQGAKIFATDTASAIGSSILDLGMGTTTIYQFLKSGTFLVVDGTGTAPGFGCRITGDSFSRVFNGLDSSDNPYVGFGTGSASRDTFLLRDGAANTVGIRNGANAETLRLYNTYTDSANYERIAFNGGTSPTITTEHAGTGSARNLFVKAESGASLMIGGNAAANWSFNSTNMFGPTTDNTFDQGDSTHRTRNLYVGTKVVTPTILTSVFTTATNYTASVTDRTILISATGTTQTLPTAVGVSGQEYILKLTASGSATVATTSSQNIDGATTYSLSAQYKFLRVQSDGTQWWIIGSN